MTLKWEVLKYFIREYDRYINENYKGGETTQITSNPYLIVEFLWELYKINNTYLSFVKEVILRWSSSEYRGWGPERSYLIIDKEFAQKIQLKGHFKWTDKGWGDFSASLSYDLSSL